MLWLDPGLRKTSITLNAFSRMLATGRARKMLVVAPLRVCQLVWRQESAKWEQFRHLRFSLLHGPKKADRLKEDADIYLINPEGVEWLAQQYKLRAATFPFDVVTIDEITKFKNSQAKRHKALRPLLKHVRHRWGLTGTPAPNGYMDLFGQWLLVDDGAALGRFITHYRDTYFQVGFNGFDYDLQPSGAKRIEKKLEPYVFRLSGEDYLTLPPVIDNLIEVELDTAARKLYDTMRTTMLAELPGGLAEGSNAGGVYTKLRQMAGGAVYVDDGSVAHLHDAKIEALDDLIEELAGQQLLIGYEFQHEADRLRDRYGDKVVFFTGATEKQAVKIQDDWNAGRIQILACHPASAGHGLNLQDSAACHLCWFTPTVDLELWDQFIRRLRRSGNTAARIMRHILVAKNTVDDLMCLPTVAEKDTTQTGLLKRLNVVLRGGEIMDVERDDMVAKLSRQATPAAAGSVAPKGWGKPAEAPETAQAAQAAQEPAAAAPAASVTPKGWGKPAAAQEPAAAAPAAGGGNAPLSAWSLKGKLAEAAAEAAADEAGQTGAAGEVPDEEAQREAVRAKLTGFSSNVQRAAETLAAAVADPAAEAGQADATGDDPPFEPSAPILATTATKPARARRTPTQRPQEQLTAYDELDLIEKAARVAQLIEAIQSPDVSATLLGRLAAALGVETE